VKTWVTSVVFIRYVRTGLVREPEAIVDFCVKNLLDAGQISQSQ